MAKIANTAKLFNFAIEINGLNQFEVQTVELPQISVEVAEHGDVNYNVKTPGRITTGDLKLEKIRPLPTTDNWAWSWFNAGADPFTGVGALAGNIKRVIVVRELDSSGLVAVNSYLLEGCFIKSIEFAKYDRMSTDNVIETITISVDRMRKI